MEGTQTKNAGECGGAERAYKEWRAGRVYLEELVLKFAADVIMGVCMRDMADLWTRWSF